MYQYILFFDFMVIYLKLNMSFLTNSCDFDLGGGIAQGLGLLQEQEEDINPEERRRRRFYF